MMCAGNTIKTTAGNVANCDADDACDGMTTVPNENHTACGTSLILEKTIWGNDVCESVDTNVNDKSIN